MFGVERAEACQFYSLLLQCMDHRQSVSDAPSERMCGCVCCESTRGPLTLRHCVFKQQISIFDSESEEHMTPDAAILTTALKGTDFSLQTDWSGTNDPLCSFQGLISKNVLCFLRSPWLLLPSLTHNTLHPVFNSEHFLTPSSDSHVVHKANAKVHRRVVSQTATSRHNQQENSMSKCELRKEC